MQRTKLAIFLAPLALGILPTQAAVAQDDAAARRRFANLYCSGNSWETLGYSSFLECYHDYYNNYPNDPRNP